MASDLFKTWLEPSATANGVRLYSERNGSRLTGMSELKRLLGDHFVGEATILQAGGYQKAADIIRNSLPGNKRTQSGDLGELIATEYVDAETNFRVPIRKLRWKSDRQMPMHGNDVIAIDSTSKPVRILKGECKSRAICSATVADEAAKSLDAHDGRPNPSTLAFITKRLYEEKRDAEARLFQDLQCSGAMTAKNITHMTFVLSGKDPSALLASAAKPSTTGVKKEAAAVVVADHAAFVSAVFTTHGS